MKTPLTALAVVAMTTFQPLSQAVEASNNRVNSGEPLTGQAEGNPEPSRFGNERKVQRLGHGAYGCDAATAVKAHERPALNAQRKDSLSCTDNVQKQVINRPAITTLNSVRYTSKLDDLSEHPVKEIIHKVLKNDARKTFDKAANQQFRRTFMKAQPAAGNSPTVVDFVDAQNFGAATTTQLTKEHVKLIVDRMKERDIEPRYCGALAA